MGEWRARGGDGTCPRLLEVGREWARFGEDLFWARRPGCVVEGGNALGWVGSRCGYGDASSA